MPEAVFTILYVFINIGVAAYIVGTTTLLIVKGDEATGAYRSSLTVLDAYTSTHEIPRVRRRHAGTAALCLRPGSCVPLWMIRLPAVLYAAAAVAQV